MVKKILVFRTDRIGDLIVNCPSIITIKNYFPESEITLVASDRNIEYAKSLNIFRNIHSFPKKNLIKKIMLIYKLNKEKYDFVFIFDGKERSIISSFFLTSKIKVGLVQSIKPYYKFSNIKFFKDHEKTNLENIFKDILKYCNINIDINSYNFLEQKKDNNFSKSISVKNFTLIHYDEKWYNNLYIKSYTNINPSYKEFCKFAINLSEKNHVVISTGIKDVEEIKIFRDNFFEKINNKIFINKKFKNFIYLIFRPSYEDIESLLRQTKILVACHGSITHASNSFKIKKIDILEKNKIKFYNRFTSYLLDYYPIYRANFASLESEIRSKVELLN